MSADTYPRRRVGRFESSPDMLDMFKWQCHGLPDSLTHVVAEFDSRGWPEPAAEKMATFLCGGHEIPRWEDLVEPKPTAGER